MVGGGALTPTAQSGVYRWSVSLSVRLGGGAGVFFFFFFNHFILAGGLSRDPLATFSSLRLGTPGLV